MLWVPNFNTFHKLQQRSLYEEEFPDSRYECCKTLFGKVIQSLQLLLTTFYLPVLVPSWERPLNHLYCNRISAFFILTDTEKKDINSSDILVVNHKCFSSSASQNLSCKPKSNFSKAFLMTLAALFMLSMYPEAATKGVLE